MSLLNQNAGILIGEGTYGKVYRPHIPCKNKTFKNNVVGKVFADKDDYDNEVEIAKLIKNLNVKNEFSIPFYDNCDENMEIIYKNGGQDLYDYMINHNNHDKFYDILYKMRYICNGIQILIKNGLVHQDIKLENIVYNGEDLYLIDYGLMTQRSIVYNIKAFLTYDYIAFPPEYKRHEYGIDFNIKFLKNFNGGSMLTFIQTFYIDYKKDLLTLMDKPSYPTNKIDIYSLGMVICSLYKWYNHRDVNIEELICGMICFNPNKRWTINKVIKWFANNMPRRYMPSALTP